MSRLSTLDLSGYSGGGTLARDPEILGPVEPVIYLIGPSCVGKSTAAAHLADTGEVTHLDLDGWIRESRLSSYTWPTVEPLFAELEAAEATLPVILDIGAGTQDMEHSHGDRGLRHWLSQRSSRVVLVDAPPEEISGRNPHHGGSHQSFLRYEYAPERLLLYATAGTSVWVGALPQPDSVATVVEALRRVARLRARGAA